MLRGLKSTKKRWTEVEKNYLATNAGSMKDEDIAKNLRKSLKAVRDQRARMEIKKKCGRGIVALDLSDEKEKMVK